MAKPDKKPQKRTRIQARNRQLILDAALGVFSAYGFRGATLDQIAEAASMSKPNLLYYFRRKEDVYLAVLEHTLDDWLEPLKALDPQGDLHLLWIERDDLSAPSRLRYLRGKWTLADGTSGSP